MRSRRRLALGVPALAVVYAVAALGPLLAVYDPDTQHREQSFAAPTPIHLLDEEGHWHRPFVYADDASHPAPTVGVSVPRQRYPIQLWSSRAIDGLNGTSGERRSALGVAPPADLFLLGTDRYGRDRWSRLVMGARTSLGAGLVAAILSVGLGFLLGGVAGARGGWIDRWLMRVVDVFLAVPWLYLLLAARAALPLDVDPGRAFLLLAVVIGFVGWARPARLVRAVVLRARQDAYVEAARSLGASEWHVLRTHLLPQAGSVVLTQGTILAPQFTLAEMTLSFLGLGLAAPLASWGTLLNDVARDHLLQPTWYALAPVYVVVGVFVVYHWAAESLGLGSMRTTS